MSTDSLLDRIPPVCQFTFFFLLIFIILLQADTAGPRVSSGVRKSLEILTRSCSMEQR